MDCVKIRFAPPTEPFAARRTLERAVKSVNRRGLWRTLYWDFFAFAELPGDVDDDEPTTELSVVESPFFCILLCPAFDAAQLREIAATVEQDAEDVRMSYADLTPEEAEAFYREALDTCRAVPAAAPELASACEHLGLMLFDADRPEEAEPLYREALGLYRLLSGRRGIAEACYRLARILAEQGRAKEAETLYCEAMDIYKELCKRDGEHEEALARTYRDLASFLRDNGRAGAAEWFYRKALELYGKLSERNAALYAPNVATACQNLAGLLQSAGRLTEAAELYRVALDTYTKLVQEDPAAWEPELAFLYENLSLFEGRLSPQAGKALLQSAYLLYQKYPDLRADAQRVLERIQAYE